MPFIADQHMPGCLPDAEPEEFDTAEAAWDYLRELRAEMELQSEEFEECAQFTAAVDIMKLLAEREHEAAKGRSLASDAFEGVLVALSTNGLGYVQAAVTVDRESERSPMIYEVGYVHAEVTECTITTGHFTGQPICTECADECDCLVCSADAHRERVRKLNARDEVERRR